MPARIVIFDLDGTIANCSHRSHLARVGQWHAFNIACMDDEANEAVARLARYLSQFFLIWVVTGRPIELKERTRQWLRERHLIPDNLLMRPAGNTQEGWALKKAWLADGTIPVQDVLCVFEDRDADVAMWREAGLTCLQVAPGAF